MRNSKNIPTNNSNVENGSSGAISNSNTNPVDHYLEDGSSGAISNSNTNSNVENGSSDAISNSNTNPLENGSSGAISNSNTNSNVENGSSGAISNSNTNSNVENGSSDAISNSNTNPVDYYLEDGSSGTISNNNTNSNVENGSSGAISNSNTNSNVENGSSDAISNSNTNPVDYYLENGSSGAISNNNTNAREIIIQRFSIPITRSLMKCLKPGGWLNDEVIHFTMHMLEDRDGLLCIRNENRKQSHFFSTFFMDKLLVTDRRYNYENIKSWTRELDVFALNKIFFPINITNSHWTLAVIFMNEKRIQYYDSMGSTTKKYIKALMKYHSDEAIDKNKESINNDDWNLVTCDIATTPQ